MKFSLPRRRTSQTPSTVMYTAIRCGHLTKVSGEVTAFGESTTTTMPIGSDDTVEYCLDCIGQMAVPCAWCGKPVFIGDPVTLSTPIDPGFVIADGVVTYSTDPLCLVGCLRFECCDTAAMRAGFWMPGKDGTGCVERVPTAFELLVSDPTITSISVSNVGDPNEQPTITRL